MNARTLPDIGIPASVNQPPHSVEAEQAVLGCLLRNNAVADEINVAEADFYLHDHRLIWRAIVGLIDRNKPADVITVAEALGAELDRVGGLPYMVELSSNAPAAANLKHYAGTVKGRAMLRNLAAAAEQIAGLAYANGDAGMAVAEAQQVVMELDATAATQESVSLSDALRDMVERVDATYHGTAKVTKTGFTDLDAKIVGLEPGDVVVVAGRPSMGKTAFSMQIAEHVSETETVQVFSLEMPAQALAMRQAASVGKIDLMNLRSGQMSEGDWKSLTYALGRLHSRPMYIDDRSGLSVHQIRARARQTKRKYGLGLIVIDYIGLIAGGGGGDNRATVLGEISRNIKSMARELAVPVLLLCQLNRQVTGRTDKRPLISDLRESGAIEQDADLILMLHRDEYYDPDSHHKGIAECIIGKQRNGPTGIVPLAFSSEYARFSDADHDALRAVRATAYAANGSRPARQRGGFDD